MTEEEIEKQAEEYVAKYYKEPNSVMSIDEITEVMVKQAHKAGAKWGITNAIEWHDLRENPNDLPKEIEICSAPVYVISKHGSSDLAQYDYRQKLWCYKHSNEHILYDVIAWCEQPQFKEICE